MICLEYQEVYNTDSGSAWKESTKRIYLLNFKLVCNYQVVLLFRNLGLLQVIIYLILHLLRVYFSHLFLFQYEVFKSSQESYFQDKLVLSFRQESSLFLESYQPQESYLRDLTKEFLHPNFL